jgi:hypothetical protein
MKRIVVVAPLAAALAVLSSATVLGQTQGAQPAITSAAPQQEKTKPAARTGKRSRANVDARHCLQFATNLEIHKCAEKYR